MVSIRILGLSLLLVGTLATPVALAIDKGADLFDQAVNKEAIPLPQDPLNPESKPVLSCIYYPNFIVKQIDLGEKGAAQLSIIPTSGDTKNYTCRQENVSSEAVIEDWEGYFKGVKGNYVFFAADDGWNGGVGFVVYDGMRGNKIFEDVAENDFSDIQLTPTSIELKYKRVYLAPCSMRVDAAGCWQSVKKDTGLNISPPDCDRAYQKAFDEDKKHRHGIPEDEIRQQLMDDPSVLYYAVDTKLDANGQTTTPISDKIECRPAE